MYHHEYRGMKFKLKYHKEIDNTIVNNNPSENTINPINPSTKSTTHIITFMT